MFALIDNITPHHLASDIGKISKVPVLAAETLHSAVEILEKKVEGKTVIATLGAGDVSTVAHELKRRLERHAEAKQTPTKENPSLQTSTKTQDFL